MFRKRQLHCWFQGFPVEIQLEIPRWVGWGDVHPCEGYGVVNEIVQQKTYCRAKYLAVRGCLAIEGFWGFRICSIVVGVKISRKHIVGNTSQTWRSFFPPKCVSPTTFFDKSSQFFQKNPPFNYCSWSCLKDGSRVSFPWQKCQTTWCIVGSSKGLCKICG